MKQNIKLVGVLLVTLCCLFSGCAILNLPFKVLGEAVRLIKAAPKPPPGVF